MKVRAIRWWVYLGAFGSAILISAVAFAQFATPPTYSAGTVGAACTSSSVNYAWPDANGHVLQCVSNVWTLVSQPSSAAGSNGQVQFNSSGNLGASSNLFWDNTNNRLGIGTTVPTTIFNVYGPMSVPTTQSATLAENVPAIIANNTSALGAPGLLFGDGPIGSSPNYGGIFSSWGGSNVSGGMVNGMTFISPRDLDGGYSNATINWGFRFNSAGGSTRMFIDTASGNVGIATTSPGMTLDVEGNIRADAGGGLIVRSPNLSTVGTLAGLNTGVTTLTGYLSSGGALAFYTANTSGTNLERVRIDSSGNVGIGTTVPITKLHIYGNNILLDNAASTYRTYQIETAETPRWQFGANNTAETGNDVGSDFYIQKGTDAGSWGAIPFFIQRSTGNVGIGTNSPTSLLYTNDSVAKTANYTGVLHNVIDTSSTASVNKVGMDVESTGTWNGTSAVNTGLIVNATGGTTNYAATFNGGNVGIGTTNPQHPLEVYGTVKVGGNNATQQTGTIALGDDLSTLTSIGIFRGTLGGLGGGNYLNVGGYAGIAFNADGSHGFGSQTTRMLIDGATGNVGIGTTAPQYPLDMTVGSGSGINVNASSGQADIYLGQTGTRNGGLNAQGGGGTDIILFAKRNLHIGEPSTGPGSFSNGTIVFNTSDTERARIDSNGNVGIGTNSPSYLLQVGSASATGIVMELQTSSGTCTMAPSTSSMTTTCSSDVRLKTDIRDSEEALPWLTDMRVRDFTIKATGESSTGVIAQEVLVNHPDMVRLTPDGFYAVDVPNPWKMIKAIQELKALNDALKARQDTLETQTVDLKATNDDEAAEIKELGDRLDALETARR